MPDRTPRPNTKPLKPYRRGETLGKQGLKLRKPSAHKGKTSVAPTAPGLKPKPAVEREAQAEDGGEKIDGGAEEEEMYDEEEEEQVQEQGPPAKGVSGKKGKKFLDNDAMLSLVASIAGARETKNRQKVAKLKKKKKAVVPAEVRKTNNAQNKKAELDAAKAVVSAQARAKKDVKLGREPKADKPNAGADGGERKRVSFA